MESTIAKRLFEAMDLAGKAVFYSRTEVIGELELRRCGESFFIFFGGCKHEVKPGVFRVGGWFSVDEPIGFVNDAISLSGSNRLRIRAFYNEAEYNAWHRHTFHSKRDSEEDTFY